MLDKFIAMQLWQALDPIAHDDDEDELRCAIAMQRELNLWNKEREKRGERQLGLVLILIRS